MLPLGWIAQFSFCWPNSASGRWLVENSLETSRLWILHWGRLLGKMQRICLCIHTTRAPCSALPLYSFHVNTKPQLLMLSSRISTESGLFTRRGALLAASVTCHVTRATQTWGFRPKHKSLWPLWKRCLAFSSIVISLRYSEYRLRLIPHEPYSKRKTCSLSGKAKDVICSGKCFYIFWISWFRFNLILASSVQFTSKYSCWTVDLCSHEYECACVQCGSGLMSQWV